MRITRNSHLRSGKISLMPVLIAAIVLLAATSVVGQEMDDADISVAVSEALTVDDGVSGYLVDVSTVDGVVTLSGTVNNLLAKERAARVAETIKGVRAVVNKLTLTTKYSSDEELAEDVQAALLVDPVTEAYELDVMVEDGAVTLSGTVQSWQEKQLAANVVKGIRGVQGIFNNIVVEYTQERSDQEIKQEIRAKLHWDALVDDALIGIEVNDGEVTLSGLVGSAAEKRRATWDAWTMGVDKVDNDGLTVESWARDERFRKGKYVEKEDPAITRAVDDALTFDPRVNSMNVDVSVNNGVVTLSGSVDDLRAKRAAAQDARNTVGVWRVKNGLLVRPDESVDTRIGNSIRNALSNDPYVSRHQVMVSVVDGKAILNGTVDSYFEKTQADEAASSITGVVAVDNNLEVVDSFDALTYDPYVDEFDHSHYYDYDWYVHPKEHAVVFSDWEIRENIKDELWWSPFVDSDEVIVTVNDGIATLTGTVDTWRERQVAEENAYQAGALVVNNDLNVDFGPDFYQP